MAKGTLILVSILDKLFADLCVPPLFQNKQKMNTHCAYVGKQPGVWTAQDDK